MSKLHLVALLSVKCSNTAKHWTGLTTERERARDTHKYDHFVLGYAVSSHPSKEKTTLSLSLILSLDIIIVCSYHNYRLYYHLPSSYKLIVSSFWMEKNLMRISNKHLIHERTDWIELMIFHNKLHHHKQFETWLNKIISTTNLYSDAIRNKTFYLKTKEEANYSTHRLLVAPNSDQKEKESKQYLTLATLCWRFRQTKYNHIIVCVCAVY